MYMQIPHFLRLPVLSDPFNGICLKRPCLNVQGTVFYYYYYFNIWENTSKWID